MTISIFPYPKNLVRSRRPRRLFLFLPVFLLLCIFHQLNGSLSFGQEKQRSSESEQEESSRAVPVTNSLESHKEWLRNNQGHNNYYTVLRKTINLFTDIDNVISFLKEQIQNLKTDSQRFQILHILGKYEKLSGDFGSAQRHYQLASTFNEGVLGLKALFTSAYLLFQMGELDRCENQIKILLSNENILDEKTLKQTWLLYSNVLTAKKEIENAKQICDMIYKKYENSLSSQELYLLYTISRRLQLTEIQKKTAKIIREKYPQSAEYSLVYGGPVDELIWPRRYLVPEEIGGKDIPVLTENNNTVKEDLNYGYVMIQTGSYKVIENAKTMVTTLKKKGFSAVIREKKVKNKTYYTVVLPNIPKEKSQEILIKLKDKGIEGFLIY